MPELPPIPYGRQWIEEDDVEAVNRVLRGDWLTTGPLVETFERALAERAGARFAVAVSSGTAALHAAYHAAGLGEGAEILTSPLTFISTVTTARQLGAGFRLVDIDPETGNLDPSSIEEKIGPATRVIVSVDYAGHPADYDTIRAVAERHSLILVADAAHSFGATYRGRPVGSLADATATSFHPVKPITTGEGGAVFTDRDGWRERAEIFRNHGIVRDRDNVPESEGDWYYEVREPGLNYRLPDILCALGLSQLGKLDRFLARRREIARRYTESLASAAGLQLPVVREGVDPGWHLYVIQVNEATRRKPLFDYLHRHGLKVQVHYIPVHFHPLFKDVHQPGACLPHAEAFAARAISLPIFPKMTDRDVDRVIDIVLKGAREHL